MVLLSCTAALWLHQRGAKEEGGGGLRDGKNVVIVLSSHDNTCRRNSRRQEKGGEHKVSKWRREQEVTELKESATVGERRREGGMEGGRAVPVVMETRGQKRAVLNGTGCSYQNEDREVRKLDFCLE
ncbi:hypothetical protein FQA47_020554 [Oryzias melastigma]|uniref:Uncharacterized protein n=1 Tax=Oryzias melastigma TaxID=30732 RepID=A0A834CUQ0_ORYME|nr:hypothetical protein FQA47_020554 [Oryzias melastigma]